MVNNNFFQNKNGKSADFETVEKIRDIPNR